METNKERGDTVTPFPLLYHIASATATGYLHCPVRYTNYLRDTHHRALRGNRCVEF